MQLYVCDSQSQEALRHNQHDWPSEEKQDRVTVFHMYWFHWFFHTNVDAAVSKSQKSDDFWRSLFCLI